MITKEKLEIISKPWCSNQDIMKIANVYASTASKIKRSIRKKEPNKFVAVYYIPTKEVIKYFEFLKSIAYFDKEINDGLPK